VKEKQANLDELSNVIFEHACRLGRGGHSGDNAERLAAVQHKLLEYVISTAHGVKESFNSATFPGVLDSDERIGENREEGSFAADS
jgi:hypothetical protein